MGLGPLHRTVAEPGFPVGGRGPRRGAMDPRGGYVSKNLHVKMRESGPVGRRPPRSANGLTIQVCQNP